MCSVLGGLQRLLCGGQSPGALLGVESLVEGWHHIHLVHINDAHSTVPKMVGLQEVAEAGSLSLLPRCPTSPQSHPHFSEPQFSYTETE